MAPTLEERVEVLEGKVETLETNAGPGRADAHAVNLADLRTQFAKFGEVQAKQSQTLDIHTGKFNSFDRSMVAVRLEVGRLRTDLTEFKNEASGKLERLDNNVAVLQGDVTWLKGMAGKQEGLIIALSTDAADLKDDINGLTIKVGNLQEDVAGLKTDVAGLKTDVAELKTDVAGLKTDVAELKTDVAELKTDVAGLKTDVAVLKTDVAGLKTDVAVLKTDVAGLKTDVAGLKADFAEFKVEVRGTLAEILDRLPAKAA